MEDLSSTLDMQTTDTKLLIEDILNVVNKLPLKTKDDRIKVFRKMIELQFTTDPKEAWVDDEKNDDADDADESDDTDKEPCLLDEEEKV